MAGLRNSTHRSYHSPAKIYFFKHNNRNTKKSCGICSTSTIKTPDRRLKLFEKIIDAGKPLLFSQKASAVILVSWVVTLNIFHIFPECFYCWLWTSKCLLSYDGNHMQNFSDQPFYSKTNVNHWCFRSFYSVSIVEFK